MNLNLKNKNALVCGGSRGLGAATAIELAELGANITLLARNEKNLKKVLKKLKAKKNQVHDYIVFDFSEGEKKLKKKIEKLLSKKNIHILINNTGGPAGGNLEIATVEEFKKAFQNHIITSHILVKLLKPGMLADNYGRIINIVSTSVRQPIMGLAVSNVTRGAMASWAKTLALELAPTGITVNNILPGTTQTERIEELFGLPTKNDQLFKGRSGSWFHERNTLWPLCDTNGNCKCRGFCGQSSSLLSDWGKHSRGWWKDQKHIASYRRWSSTVMAITNFTDQENGFADTIRTFCSPLPTAEDLHPRIFYPKINIEM